MSAYRQAIEATCKGKLVCEIGVGLGPLSLMALQAGAKRVYGIEIDGDALEAAKAVIAANGFGPGRFIGLRGRSDSVQLPERVHVILSETLDSMGVGENTAAYMADAKRRFLRASGRFLPERLECFVALAHPSAYLEQLAFWKEQMPEFGMNYDTLADLHRGAKHTISIANDDLAGPFMPWLDIDFNAAPPAMSTAMLLPATKTGPVSGLAIAFDATLAPDVHIRTYPDDPLTHWKQGFQPFPQRWLEVTAGQLVYVEAHVRSPSGSPSVQTQLVVAAGPPDEVRAFARKRVAETPGLVAVFD